jgi:hypothetical protein
MQSACAVFCCHVWLILLYHIFPHCLINGTIFEKENIIGHKMCVLIFFTTFVWNDFPCKKISASYYRKRTYVLMWSNRCFVIFYSNANLIDIFETYSNIKFHKKSVSGSRIFLYAWTDERTDRYNENNSHFSSFSKASNIWRLFRSATRNSSCNRYELPDKYPF